MRGQQQAKHQEHTNLTEPSQAIKHVQNTVPATDWAIAQHHAADIHSQNTTAADFASKRINHDAAADGQQGIQAVRYTDTIDNLQEQLDDSKKENNSTKQKENKNDTKKKDNQQSDDAGTDEPPVEDNTSNGNTSDQEGTNDTNNETTEMQWTVSISVVFFLTKANKKRNKKIANFFKNYLQSYFINVIIDKQ